MPCRGRNQETHTPGAPKPSRANAGLLGAGTAICQKGELWAVRGDNVVNLHVRSQVAHMPVLPADYYLITAEPDQADLVRPWDRLDLRDADY